MQGQPWRQKATGLITVLCLIGLSGCGSSIFTDRAEIDEAKDKRDRNKIADDNAKGSKTLLDPADGPDMISGVNLWDARLICRQPPGPSGPSQKVVCEVGGGDHRWGSPSRATG